ncbi:MAG: alpha/beta hydrolase [Deltaproteobacteria bacterium]|nr:alpha/beta hydrolase [Deltaproteobacteria bacterium]
MRGTTVNRTMTWIFLIVGIYLALGVVLFLMQRRLIYPIPRAAIAPNALSARLLRIPVAKNVTGLALHYQPREGEPTVVHFHGNAEQLADQEQLAEWFVEAGVGFFAVEYPGYGLAENGAPNERAIYQTAEAALKHLSNELQVPKRLTVLQGQSLGTGVAVEMARRGYGSRLSLISPYTSMADMAATVAPFFPVRWLLLDRYDNASKAPMIELPTLIIHGSQDEVIPFRMAEQLADRFPNRRLHIVKGAHHNDLFSVGGQELMQRIVAFSLGIKG